jgi:hypothetical protein
MQIEGMQHVYTARDALDANFLKGLLEQEGINSVVQGEPLQETWGNLPLSDESLPSVWVAEQDVPKALPIVEDYKRRDQADAALDELPPRPTWTCPNCGQNVEEQFTQCWHCGHNRPAAGPAGGTALA